MIWVQFAATALTGTVEIAQRHRERALASATTEAVRDLLRRWYRALCHVTPLQPSRTESQVFETAR